jgi:hypothetical protein
MHGGGICAQRVELEENVNAAEENSSPAGSIVLRAFA